MSPDEVETIVDNMSSNIEARIPMTSAAKQVSRMEDNRNRALEIQRGKIIKMSEKELKPLVWLARGVGKTVWGRL